MKFDLEDKELIRSCRPVLDRLYKEHKKKYVDLFFYEKDILFTNFDLSPLVDVGILKNLGGKFRANVMVFPFMGKFIVTDFLYSIHRKKGGQYLRRLDDVWPMYPHETLNFIKSLNLSKGRYRNKKALDMASGSGAISLFLADYFKNVVSVDINPKAVNYSRFNSILNGLEGKIKSIRSNLFSSLKNEKFDYVIWNGPTGAFPPVKNPRKHYPFYIYGGADGTEFTKKFLLSFLKFVNKSFDVKFLDCSLGTNKESLIESFLKERFSGKPINIQIEFLNKNGRSPLSGYDKLYRKYCSGRLPMNIKQDKEFIESAKKYPDWIKINKLNYVYFSYITIRPGSRFDLSYKYPKKSTFLPRHNFGFEWHVASAKLIERYLREYNPA